MIIRLIEFYLKKYAFTGNVNNDNNNNMSYFTLENFRAAILVLFFLNM